MTDIISKCIAGSGIELWGCCEYTPELLLNGSRSVNRLPDGASSVIVCAFPWFAGIPTKRNVSLYAIARDYHTIAGDMLKSAAKILEQNFQQNSFVPFIDASPIDEVKAGCLSGIGVLGLNFQLITEKYGSMVFIGEIVTNLKLPFAKHEEKNCEGCMACINACPTGALGKNGLNRPLCRSFITQKKGGLTEWEAEQVAKGGLIWGCDICTLSCPHNNGLSKSNIGGFTENLVPVIASEDIDMLLTLHSYGWRGREVLERNLNILLEKTT